MTQNILGRPLAPPSHPFPAVPPPRFDPDATVVIGRHRADHTTTVALRSPRGGWIGRAVVRLLRRSPAGGVR